MTTLLIILHLLQSVFSFWLLQKTFRYDTDMRRKDVIFFGIFSLVPVAWFTAILIWLAFRPRNPRKESPIWLEKYK